MTKAWLACLTTTALATATAAALSAEGDNREEDGSRRGERRGLRQAALAGAHLAEHRSLPGWTLGGRGRRAQPAHDLLLRRHGRRGLQDHERRSRLEARHGRPDRHGLGGSRRGRRVGPERRVCRHGRGVPARQPLARRRGLQVHGCGQDLGAGGPQGHAAHRRVGGPSQEPRPRLRGRAGPRLRPQPGARRLPQPRRRQDLGQGPLRGREHGGGGPGHGPHQPARALRRHCTRCGAAPWGFDSGGPGSGL